MSTDAFIRNVLIGVLVVAIAFFTLLPNEAWRPSIVCNLVTTGFTIWVLNVVVANRERRQHNEVAGWALRSPMVRMGDLIIRTAEAIRTSQWSAQHTMIVGGWKNVHDRFKDLVPYALANATPETRTSLHHIDELTRRIASSVTYGPSMSLPRELGRLLLLIRELDGRLLGYNGTFMDGADQSLIAVGVKAAPDGKIDPVDVM